VSKKVKILLTGGGTGGHIYPGIVIADEIMLQRPEAEILFVGTRRGLESTVVPRKGYEIRYVDVRFFARRLTIKNFVTLYKAVKSVFEARKIIQDFRPDVVVGTGGYVSGPVVFAAARAKIPTLIHEQNAFPGLTTRLLASRVDKVAVSHADAVKRIKSGARTVVTGHPVRREFFETDRNQARRDMGLKAEDKLVLIVGGSGGAERINQVTLDSAAIILADANIIILHITGDRYFSWVGEERDKLCLNREMAARYRLEDFVHDIPRVMAACDIIVARAGGMVHEMTVAGCPALLIPSPNVTDDHQLHNAMAMADSGAAILIEEKNLTAESFAQAVGGLLRDSQKLKEMSAASHNLGKPEAGSRLAKIILQMADKN